MSASSVGRRVVEDAAPAASTRAAKVDDQTPGSVQRDAMAVIVGAIPSEGFATYLGIYALVLAVLVDKHGNPDAWAAYAAAGVGAAINIFALLWAAGVAWRKQVPDKRARTVVQVAWRVVAFTILYGVVIIATPDNPFARFAGVNVGYGLIAVVIAGAIVGITKKP